MTLYVLNYNNYYNRIVKKEDTLSAYLGTDDENLVYDISGVNFNPNDGIMTEQVLGSLNDVYNGAGDYLLVCDDQREIVSRWFIIETQRTRGGGLYNCILRRDIVTDNLNSILDRPMFIEKATITDPNDPAIFNRESMTFNQIKLSETFLEDETHCPWIVGYIPKSFAPEQKEIISQYNNLSANYIEVDNLSAWEDYDYYVGTKVIKGPIVDLYYGYNARITEGYKAKRASDNADVALSVPRNATFFFKNNSNLTISNVPLDNQDYGFQVVEALREWLPGGNSSIIQQVPGYTFYVKDINGYGSSYLQGWTDVDLSLGFNNYDNTTFKNQVASYLDTEGDGDFTQAKLTRFNNKYKDTILLDKSTGYQYKVSVTKGKELLKRSRWLVQGTTPFNYLNERQIRYKDHFFIINVDPKIEGTANNLTYFVAPTYYEYTLELTPVYQYAGVKLDTSIYELNDQPYYMFCMPYANNVTVTQGSTIKYQMSKEVSISLATQFAARVGKENIFDIQILPFCPARYATNAFQPTPGWVWTDEENGIGHGGNVGGIDYTSVKTPYIFDEDDFSGLFNPIKKYTKTGTADPVASNEEIGKMFWVPQGNFSFDILYEIPTKENALDLKVATETEIYRLCSPNYSGVFEFDPYMNGGVYSFNVDCSYKPYNPYIHINPNFGYLYGSDFNDQRGLIIQGDFSLPQETNAWTQYELNNKNYQNVFDRQIQNLKVNQDIQRKQQVFNATVGAIGGTLGGATSGALIGGPLGAAAGALVGGAASAFGGLLDVQYGDILRNETLDYTKDMYGYSLGNIQALPNGITKSSPLTANFKYFPFIEKYTCTEIERQAFINKLKYNGMTIMRIGTMQQYIGDELSYVKGKLIRLEDVGEDYHIVNTLADELNKGVFI